MVRSVPGLVSKCVEIVVRRTTTSEDIITCIELDRAHRCCGPEGSSRVQSEFRGWFDDVVRHSSGIVTFVSDVAP